MPGEPANINKILEIDMDTDRETQLRVRQAISVSYFRERQPDSGKDVKDDIVILVNALGAAILQAERDGVCKKGEAIRKARSLLLDLYIDATASVTNFTTDPKGNIIN